MDIVDKTLAVGICTYKRPEGLTKLLDHLERQSILSSQSSIRNTGFSVVVVDNDGDDPNIEALVYNFTARSGIESVYKIEKEPGISAARNAVFAETDKRFVDLVAMLDDDEYPEPRWLEALVLKHLETGAAVVGGPVVPVFSTEFLQMNKYSKFWSVNKTTLNGKVFVYCTCNFLLDMRQLSDFKRPLFDNAFGISGGGDTVFFRRLFFSGFDMAWSDDARVMEDIPASRSTLAWMKIRIFRKGNHSVHWERIGSTTSKSLLKTLALSARLLLYPIKLLTDPYPIISWIMEYQRIRGRYNAHFGYLYMEYVRPTVDQTALTSRDVGEGAKLISGKSGISPDREGDCRDRSKFPASNRGSNSELK